jgi:hypothetical protein
VFLFSSSADAQGVAGCGVSAELLKPSVSRPGLVSVRVARDNTTLAQDLQPENYQLLSRERATIGLRTESLVELTAKEPPERHKVSIYIHGVARGNVRATVSWSRVSDPLMVQTSEKKVVTSKVSFPSEQPLLIGNEESNSSGEGGSPDLIRLLRLRFSCG